MRREQRISVHGVCRTTRAGGGVVLVRASTTSDLRGRWYLPGGQVEHGEDPAQALARAFADQAGLTVAVTGLRDVVSDVVDLPHRAASIHSVRVLYDVVETGGQLRTATDSRDRVEVVMLDDADDLPLMPFTAAALGLSRPEPPHPVAPDLPLPGPAAADAPAPDLVLRQRVGVYAVVSCDDQVLLTRLAPGTPVPGGWTLPGGGIDHGETPLRALERELWEETGLRLRQAQVRAVVSHRWSGTPSDGVPKDVHGVRVLYTATVDPAPDGSPPTPRVLESGGTTDAAAWFPVAGITAVGLTDIARHAYEAVMPPTAA